MTTFHCNTNLQTHEKCKAGREHIKQSAAVLVGCILHGPVLPLNAANTVIFSAFVTYFKRQVGIYPLPFIVVESAEFDGNYMKTSFSSQLKVGKSLSNNGTGFFFFWFFLKWFHPFTVSAPELRAIPV